MKKEGIEEGAVKVYVWMDRFEYKRGKLFVSIEIKITRKAITVNAGGDIS